MMFFSNGFVKDADVEEWSAHNDNGWSAIVAWPGDGLPTMPFQWSIYHNHRQMSLGVATTAKVAMNAADHRAQFIFNRDASKS